MGLLLKVPNVGQQAINGNGNKTNSELAAIIYQKLLNGELRYLSPLDSNGRPISSFQLTPTNQ